MEQAKHIYVVPLLVKEMFARENLLDGSKLYIVYTYDPLIAGN